MSSLWTLLRTGRQGHRPYAPLPFFDFLGLAAMLATMIGTDVTTAGYVLGGALTFSLFMAVLIIMSKLDTDNASPIMFTLAVGLLISALFSWWPIWTVLVAFVFILFGMSGVLQSSK